MTHCNEFCLTVYITFCGALKVINVAFHSIPTQIQSTNNKVTVYVFCRKKNSQLPYWKAWNPDMNEKWPESRIQASWKESWTNTHCEQWLIVRRQTSKMTHILGKIYHAWTYWKRRRKVLCQKRKLGNENIALVEIARRLCSVMLHLREDGFKPAIYFQSVLQSRLVKQLLCCYMFFWIDNIHLW